MNSADSIPGPCNEITSQVEFFELHSTRPRILSDLTLIVAVDEVYIAKLRLAWPTWMQFRPWLRQIPVLLIHDAAFNLSRVDLDFLGDHRDIRFVPWTMEGVQSQREKMLSSLVYVPATEVQTNWYLKLDADTYATAVGKWVYDEWFEPTDIGLQPVYVASPWGYTKPPNAIEQLDNWGDSVAELRSSPRLDLPVRQGSTIVRHARMISQVFFGSTIWTRRVASFAPDRLPLPSQDTYLWYCAARLGCPTRHLKMMEYGWAHTAGLSRLKKACEQALNSG